MKFLMAVAVLCLVAVSAFSMDVQSIKCGLGVKNRQIVNLEDNFKVGDKVYCLSSIVNIKNDTFIINRWVSGNVKYDIKLNIKPYKRFRTWSYKTLRHAGVWKMEVIDTKGGLLKEKIIVVK